jgi:serine protease Do
MRSSLTQRNTTVPVPDDVSYFKNCHLPDEADPSWQPQNRRIMEESEKVDSNQGTGTGPRHNQSCKQEDGRRSINTHVNMGVAIMAPRFHVVLTAGLCSAGVALAVYIDTAWAQGRAAQAGSGGAPNITRQVQAEAPVPLPSLAPMVRRVLPAVVNVSVVMGDQEGEPGAEPEMHAFPPSPFDDFLRRFFEQQGIPNQFEPRRSPPPAGRVTAAGSAFIIDPGGEIVTNNHVVGNAEKITVVLQDNTRHPARIIGRDEQTDIALLRIDTDRPLPFVTWGDSDAASVGDWVVAVGNPFGLGGTVTAGVVSALGRNIQAGPYDDFLQLDAAINRGNSGGPTFNLSGQVIGINTAIYSPSGGNVGIGFAVPSNLARNIVQQLKEQGHVSRGWLGVQVQNISPEIARSFGLDPANPKGALVADVVPNSPASRAGFEPGDVIVRFGNREIEDNHDLPRLVAETPAGQQVDITVLRDGKERKLTATIDPLEDQQQTASPAGADRREPERTQQSRALLITNDLQPPTDLE